MNWNLIIHNEETGKFNMDFDIELAKNCPADEAYLRLYRWNPYAISIGANQNETEIDKELAAADGIDVVKRPTGGRAILHAKEVTYSVVMPVNSLSSSKVIYNTISRALVEGLKLYHPALEGLELEAIQPSFPALLQKPGGMICFASTAKHEVKFSGRKLIGSAQRKMNRTILQHGSILCGEYHLKLVDYLNLEAETKLSLGTEMKASTICLKEITGGEIVYSDIYDCLINGFRQTFDIKFREVDLQLFNA
jgi:lipoate-protein ligase A